VACNAPDCGGKIQTGAKQEVADYSNVGGGVSLMSSRRLASPPAPLLFFYTAVLLQNVARIAL